MKVQVGFARLTPTLNSIYKQIGPGERTALSQIAVQHLENTGRPLRIAIDISIWQFQIQSGQGGKNPALRTLYYRLLRLLVLSIQPLFVFDGPHKPSFKRGRQIASNGPCLPNFLAKELLRRFGYPCHTAPGEAEAECALLQRENIVDAVLSEDVDTIMFGCSMTMRTWTAEGARGSKSPTHVNVYKAESVKEEKGLDREGMILIALMSGGDYIPAGIAGCGIKIACEAAKAGFGRDLCQLYKDDTDGMIQWRERLERELQTNESNYFRQKHRTMKIPTTFPDRTVLGYYTHPAVSSIEKVTRLRDKIKWDLNVNVQELRMFVADAFDWHYLTGAKKFVRGLAPAMLAHQLIRRSELTTTDGGDPESKELAESKLVKCICGRRTHWNTGGEPELRIAYIPIDTVGLDLDSEERDDFQGYGQDVSGDEQLASEGDEIRDRSKSPTKGRGPSTYDPAQIEKTWVLETHVKLGVPLLVETWEEEMRNPKKFASRKAREKAKAATSKAGASSEALDQYVKLTKPRSNHRATKLPAKTKESTQLPPAYLAPATVHMSISQQRRVLAENINPVGQKAQKQKVPTEAKAKRTQHAIQTSTPPKDRTINPWTLAKRTPEKPRYRSAPRCTSQELDHAERACGPETLTCHPTTPPSTKKLHSRPSTPTSDSETPTRTINQNVTLRKPNPRTPTARDPTKPSPRKKRSPLQMANDLYLAGQLRTPPPATTKQEASIIIIPAANTDTDTAEPPPSQKVNRKINFCERKPATSPTSSSTSSSPASSLPSSSLPSPSTLLLFSPRPPPPPATKVPPSHDTKTTELAEGKLSDSPYKVRKPEFKKITTAGGGGGGGGGRKLVALRESLEGAWKHVEEWEWEGEGEGEVGVGAAASSSRGKGGRKVYSSVEVVDLT